MIIGLSTSNKITSRLIRWLTRSKVSHAYVRFEIAGEPLVIHATQDGINCDYYNHFIRHSIVVEEYDLLVDREKEKMALAYAVKQLDHPYDFLSIAGFVWVLINKTFGRKIKNPFRNRAAYNCSEFANHVLSRAGLDTSGLDIETTSPEDISYFLKNHNKAQQL
jgi:hypothetical protein